MKHFLAAVGFGVAVASIATPASAVVVTVTSGPNPGVVFDSGGYENETVGTMPANASPGTYSLPLFGTVTGGNTSTATATSGSSAGGPPSAYSGLQYAAITRTNGTIGLGSDFSRSIDLVTESFTLEHAVWGTNTATAFGIGNNIASTTVATAGVLAGWRYNPTFGDLGQYQNSIQDDPAPVGTPDELLAAPWNVGAWNTLSYSWNAATQAGTFTLNGVTVNAMPRQAGAGTSQAAPTTVNRFFASPGTNNTTVWMDSVPEPTSLAFVGLAGMAMLRRQRRA
ncbi:MAG: PEP-CTERM sorting domain-containing protein [Tepidisphaeraceae bacterium]